MRNRVESIIRYQKKRAELLHAACVFVEKRMQAGQPIGRALAAATRKFRRRARRLGFHFSLSSPHSMRHHWDHWKRKRQQTIFRDRRYDSTRPQRASKIDPMMLRALLALCVEKGLSLSEAFAELRCTDRAGFPSLRTLYRRLPARAIMKYAVAQRRLIQNRKDAAQQLRVTLPAPL